MARPISGEEEEDLKQIDLLPRMHITADLSKEKVRTQRIQDMVDTLSHKNLIPDKSAAFSFKSFSPL